MIKLTKMRQISMKITKLLLVFLFYFSTIYADEIRPAFLQIKALGNDTYDVLWRVPIRKNLDLSSLHVEFDSDVKSVKKADGVNIAKMHIENWQIYKKGSLANSTLKIQGLSAVNLEVILRIIDDDGSKKSLILNQNRTSYIFNKKMDKLDVAKAYTILGFEHILEGFDHLLFVACLVMIASNFRKLFWTITGFTLAHSITLFLSALGLANVPIAPIEASIALSIIFLAVEIAKNNQSSLTYRYPVVVSSSFGLLHGFGFASALMEIGLPQNERVIALAFFNVGVEFGQLFFVGFLLLTTWLLKQVLNDYVKKFNMKILSYIIGGIATMWLYQRLLAF